MTIGLIIVLFVIVGISVWATGREILDALAWYNARAERYRIEEKDFSTALQRRMDLMDEDIRELKNPYKEVNRILMGIDVTKGMAVEQGTLVEAPPSVAVYNEGKVFNEPITYSEATAVTIVEAPVQSSAPTKKPRVRGPRAPRIKTSAKINVGGQPAAVRRYSLDSLEERVHHYRTSPLSNKDIGQQYERYIGYLFFTRGYRVFYNGIVKGEADDGIDLIAVNEEKNITWIVQTKCWCKKRNLHPKTFHQLKGSLEHYRSVYCTEDERANAKGIVISTTKPTREGNEAREAIGLSYKEQPWDRNHPIVKQTAQNGKVFYKIPGDDGYDTCVVHGYFNTPSTAEAAGIPYWGNKELYEG